jgi:hypothetical protein
MSLGYDLSLNDVHARFMGENYKGRIYTAQREQKFSKSVVIYYFTYPVYIFFYTHSVQLSTYLHTK